MAKLLHSLCDYRVTICLSKMMQGFVLVVHAWKFVHVITVAFWWNVMWCHATGGVCGFHWGAESAVRSVCGWPAPWEVSAATMLISALKM